MVVDRNESDTHKWKDLFYVLARFDVISSKSGQVLDDNAVNFLSFRILDHPHKCRTIKIGSAVPIINVFLH